MSAPKDAAYWFSLTFSTEESAVKTGEQGLAKLSEQPGFSLMLLKMLEDATLPQPVKLAAAIYFKNHIKKAWPSESMGAEERRQIKAVIVGMMLVQSSSVARQLGETLAIVAEHDFPEQWPELLPELLTRMSAARADDPASPMLGLLRTLSHVLRRYRAAFKSTEVLLELKYILGLLQAPLLDLFKAFGRALDTAPPTAHIFRCLKLVAKLFYDLNYVDLPEFFEDHMADWMNGFRRYLQITPSKAREMRLPREIIDAEASDKPGVLFQLQATICKNINLYAEKYEEEFAPFLEHFLNDVWTLLLGISAAEKFDSLAIAGIKFLTSVSTGVQHQKFGNADVLQSVCANVIIPNMLFRDADEELFEDNPREYIRRDVEGSDTDTRRRAALELVRGLRKNYESQVTQFFAADVTRLLSQYRSGASENPWRAKDAAIFLITALAVKTTSAAQGATTTNELVPIADFYRSEVLPELQGASSAHPVIKADCLKFMTTFRRMLASNPADAKQFLEVAVRALEDENFVVRTYAATGIERLLSIKDEHGPRFQRSFLQDFAQPLVLGLFKCLGQSDELSQENEYMMRALLRVLAILGPAAAPMSGDVFGKLVTSIKFVAQNPRNPLFNHYLFEATACLTRAVVAAQPAALHACESLLLPLFQEILVKDVVDFVPYVFQLTALLIELSPPNAVSASYRALFPSLLVPALWERPGTVPALSRLIQAYTRHQAQNVVADNQLMPVLGIFQRLISSTATDHEAFGVLSALTDAFSAPDLAQYMPTVMRICFMRLQNSHSPKLHRCFVAWLARSLLRHGFAAVAAWADVVQPRVLGGVLETVWVAHAPCVAPADRRVVITAAIRLCCQTPEMISDAYIGAWAKLVSATLGMLSSATALSTGTTSEADRVDGIIGGDGEAGAPTVSGVGTTYSQLAFASKPDTDAALLKDTGIPAEAGVFFAQTLHNLSVANPGKLQAPLQSALGENVPLFTQLFAQARIPSPYIA